MTIDLLAEFEWALQERNPLLAGKLRPGLAAADISQALAEAKIIGEIGPLFTVYGWKNGFTIDLELRRSGKGLFPGKPFYFPSLEMAVGHFEHFAAAAKTHPEILEAVGRYFPVFSDGSNSWFGIDLKIAQNNRAMMINLKSHRPFHEAYRSIDELIADGIDANRENRPLKCTHAKNPRSTEGLIL